jgi:polyisoprenoid-binding protein YceI
MLLSIKRTTVRLYEKAINLKGKITLMATWNIDTAHTNAAFSVRHMMVATVRGHFGKVTGTVTFDPQNLAASSVDVAIDANTINTGVADRDGHLKSPDFLDVANYPNISFKSTKIEVTGDSTAKVTGDLTVHKVTRPVVLEAEFLGQFKDMQGSQRVAFNGKTKINREDWGLTWNVALETGGVLVGKDINIELDVEAIQVTEAVTA